MTTLLRRLSAIVLILACAACTTTPRHDWEQRLQGNAIVLLGEVHDNAEQHQLRLAVLRRALQAGWRPAIAMEQFDRERQADVDRARRERPRDAQHVIDQATPAKSGWDWALYRPVVALALEYQLPLIAANLSNADATKIARGGHAAVFSAAELAALGLDRPISPDWQAAQELEIDAGHCRALPRGMWPAMARAQFARDAVMAAMLREHAAHGVVLLAGNGHVRRDIGVPRWLAPQTSFSVGFVEDDTVPVAVFDAIVKTPPAPREDPCVGFTRRNTAL